MKKPNYFLIYPSISKYHIINEDSIYKKYHIRIYVVVTGILTLKIYIFLLKATGNYSFHLGNFENSTSMLTNITQNFKNDDFNNNLIFDSENGNQWTLNTLSNLLKEIKEIGKNMKWN